MSKSERCQSTRNGSKCYPSAKRQTRQCVCHVLAVFFLFIKKCQLLLEIVSFKLSNCKIHNFTTSSLPLTLYPIYSKLEKPLIIFKLSLASRMSIQHNSSDCQGSACYCIISLYLVSFVQNWSIQMTALWLLR